MKINKSIEIVRSNIMDLSSLSNVSAVAMQAVLSQHYTSVAITIVNDKFDLAELISRHPDLVFLGMKYVPRHDAVGSTEPEKIWLSDVLDANNILSTGSGGIAHERELNKELAKMQVLAAGLSTSRFFVVPCGQAAPTSTLPFPLFVKPVDRGGGLGVDEQSVVHTQAELNKKVASLAANHNADALVEQYLSGREFSVAILKNEHADTYSVMPLELIAPLNTHGARLLSNEVKSADAETVQPIADELTNITIGALGLKVFHALQGRDYGRIDIRMDAEGTPFFLEANLIPSLIANYGSFPKACVLHKSLNYEQMLLQIVNLAFARNVTGVEQWSIDMPNTYNDQLLPERP